VTFSVTGDSKGSVHLSGYFQPGPEEEMGGEDEYDSEEDDEDEDGEGAVRDEMEIR
jgi:hypothetical protein